MKLLTQIPKKKRKIKEQGGMENRIRDAVLATVRKSMNPEVTSGTQIRGQKKVVVCIAAIICEKKGMMETFGTKTDIFLDYKILENKSPKYGQSSFLIEKPYTQDGYVFCESENTKYKIPKHKFFDGSHILFDFLDKK